MRAEAVASSDANLSRARLWLQSASALELVALLVFALGYLLAYGFGNITQAKASPLWFPDSVLLCALLRSPRRKWWIYLAIAVPIRFIPAPYAAVPLWFICATTANDMVKATCAAYLLRRLPNGSSHPATMSQLATFLGVAVLLVPALSASAGAATRYLLGYGFWTSWYQWFLGDALANVVLTPALLYWCSKRFRTAGSRGVELVAWSVGFALSLVVALSLALSAYLPIAFCVPVPFLIWAATRFGLIGASTSLSLIAVLATARLVEKPPLFSMGFESNSLLFVQVFLFVISVPVLALAVLIEERSSTEKSLRESREKLRQNYEEVRYLAGKLISAQDDERKRIALELHDDVVQRLAWLSIKLASLDKGVPAAMTEAHNELSQLRQGADEAAATLRELSHQLHSSTLQLIGLPEALKGLCRTLSQQHRISIKVVAQKPEGASYEVKLCLFRVAQEALSNIVKHSNAAEATVMVAQRANQLYMDIRDDGTGFNPSDRSTGLGLISMRERVRLLNGTILIESQSAGGTTIRVCVPLETEQGP